ncbi:hypothetical protein CKK33_18000 [Mucilaginibacter sp. MD40]|uniref:hypothetical protein n=1 Tax=Mucilaginibacter sp. MD40 TaxID=2029590 RepID=UPI000BAC9830|nr:hypothetical protein [Mucilaginibacter sp. MD40]PAW95290.1 hypothetical protein CKK33_18000 [Mucilaginibacter sp. MD40]
MMIKCSWKSLFLLLTVFFLNTVMAFADDPTPCTGDPDDPNYDPNACNLPLDTWVYILVAVVLCYGAYKLYKKNAQPQLLNN